MKILYQPESVKLPFFDVKMGNLLQSNMQLNYMLLFAFKLDFKLLLSDETDDIANAQLDSWEVVTQ